MGMLEARVSRINISLDTTISVAHRDVVIIRTNIFYKDNNLINVSTLKHSIKDKFINSCGKQVQKCQKY